MGKKNVEEAEDVNTGDEEEVEYVVERIVEMRIGKGGKRQFMIKWEGFPDTANTWEPEENLACPELLNQFLEKRLKKDSGGVRSTGASSTQPPAKKKRHEELSEPEQLLPTPSSATTKARGFDRGKLPEKILGATDAAGELMFLIKWKDCDEADLVPAKVANVRCPQIVIQFYEERLTWHSHEENDVGNYGMHGAPKAQSLPRSARAPVPDVANTPAFPGDDLDKEQIDPDAQAEAETEAEADAEATTASASDDI